MKQLDIGRPSAIWLGPWRVPPESSPYMRERCAGRRALVCLRGTGGPTIEHMIVLWDRDADGWRAEQVGSRWLSPASASIGEAKAAAERWLEELVR